jgi:predicted SAM-dependent methyltransferase
MKILNVGCGFNKMPDAINVDINPDTKPDIVCDITDPLPFDNNSFDRIYACHVIEHIKKLYHKQTLVEFYRVLKPGGVVLFSYPEFKKCYKYWESNYKGLREFWEATIFGRQLNQFDYHVCIMDTFEFTQLMLDVGFEVLITESEPTQDFNTFVVASKGDTIRYDEAISLIS